MPVVTGETAAGLHMTHRHLGRGWHHKREVTSVLITSVMDSVVLEQGVSTHTAKATVVEE